MVNLSREKLGGVVCDLDDTLLPEWEYVRSGYRAASQAAYNGSGDPAAAAEAWLWSRYLEGNHAGSLDALSDRVGGQISSSELLTVYREHQPEVHLVPDVTLTLDLFRRHGLRLGVISDGPLESQQRKVEALGLHSLVDHVRLTDIWGRPDWKPSKRAFLEVEQLWQMKGTQLVYIGDNLSKDFVAPNALGWRTVHFKVDRQVHAGLPAPSGGLPQHTVASWKALRTLVRSWL